MLSGWDSCHLHGFNRVNWERSNLVTYKFLLEFNMCNVYTWKDCGVCLVHDFRWIDYLL
jgi:hypothetical protein